MIEALSSSRTNRACERILSVGLFYGMAFFERSGQGCRFEAEAYEHMDLGLHNVQKAKELLTEVLIRPK